MKKTFLLLVLTAVTGLVTGCDFFRSLAGRPTSEQLALKCDSLAEVARVKAEEEARLAALEQQRLAAIAAAEQFSRDSLAAEEEIRTSKIMVLTPEKLKGTYNTQLERKYYVVAGSFRERPNAEKKLRNVQEAGFEAVLISFRNGFHAIGAAPTDSVTVVLSSLKQLKAAKVCPNDAWILLNDE
ncbi:MAG: hypothetical protein IKR96_06950 [Bacteroidales bacterium]|nr:hypothetical protein [Bacteroidales bacterium]